MDTQLAAELLTTYREVARAGTTGDLSSALQAVVSKDQLCDAQSVREDYPDVPLEVVACEQVDWWACAYLLSNGPASGQISVQLRTFRKVDGRWRIDGGSSSMSSTRKTPLELVSEFQRHPPLDGPDPRTKGNPGGPSPSPEQLGARPAWLNELLRTFDFTPPGEWGGTILSTRTILRPSGAPGVPEDDMSRPDAPELALVTELAKCAAERMGGLEVFASQASNSWAPFWCARTQSQQVESLASAAVRAIFGGSVWPDAAVVSEPMDAGIGALRDAFRRVRGQRKSWATILRASEESGSLEGYRRAVQWFVQEPRFVETAVITVATGDHPCANAFPRLFLGRTEGGSVAGIVGVVVDNAGGEY